MNLWRLEILRLTRTRRWVALVGVYVLFGLIGPLSTRYMEQLLSSLGNSLQGMSITLPAPTAAAAIDAFVKNATQIGTIVVVVVAAGALAFDSVPEMGIFLRTRVPNVTKLLLPRYVVTTIASAIAFTLGVLTAWYETWALIGQVDATAIATGIAYGVLYLAVVVAVVAATSQWFKTVLPAVMAALVILILMPTLGLFNAIADWVPSRLTSALPELAAGASTTDYLPAALTSIVLIFGLAAVAVLGARRVK
ncbi:MAG: hypothetical protein Q8L05_11440 [Actinomycetota bacterium]|nr:hypothetical protein [Actinomycetota bacterium]MDP2288878.1 hypothetical protein [Actinomycetota bacterium]